MRKCRFYAFAVLLVFAPLSSSTLSKSDKGKSKSGNYKKGPQSSNVQSRRLVSPEPLARDILVEHGAFYEETGERAFGGRVLGYVTPWNGAGYDVAKTFAPKFTHISPVWLQIRRRGKLRYEITGKHDIDAKWMKDVRKRNPNVRIDVRVLFDGWTIQDFTDLFVDYAEQERLTKTLVDFCKKEKFDGAVLELWSQIGGSIRRDVLIEFVALVGENLRENDLELILVVPPSRGEIQSFTADDFNELVDSVTAFSLMTYDYSSPQRPGPNSPIKWIRTAVENLAPSSNDTNRSKILLGFNFYGYDYTVSGGGPIVGHEFIKLLKHHKGKLKYDDESEENFFEVRTDTGKHIVFYPTLYSVAQRIKLAEELGTGISIWELGQGLDYFYDLF